MKNKRPAIKTFDDFEKELGMLPDGREPDFNIANPIEMHFFQVADKHGVIDEMIDGEDE